MSDLSISETRRIIRAMKADKAVSNPQSKATVRRLIAKYTYPDVRELTKPPKIGSTYLVPCVKVEYDGNEDWYPILGTRHNDAEFFAVKADHFHFDLRFLNLERWFWLERLTDKQKAEKRMIAVQINFSEVTLRPMVCLRTMPKFPAKFNKLYKKFEAAHKDCKLDLTCKRCPHRGTDLRSVRPKGGVIECPSHGLHWNAKTGEFISRVEERLNSLLS